ncbi:MULTISPECIES: DUF3291 domain-containing protein [unclassified Maribacter]|uniref:DUF3291 domain-containing protein n=1 Tax=unclassified Maribacter TaxID=2615042 RepID=UPI000ECA4607|nr:MULTISPECIES: DUF3291 domain-containing protein [unclassified Maribacter]HAI37500.1 DUF3291 domain-containing protein [Maribacter sp.]|tara:strand:- start:35 stop:496 length:462 start_codon:yes stop_codon:yes gene_type:complete
MLDKKYQLAQINISRMIGVNINDPIMKEFVDNLDKVNNLAEQSEGFVWRLKDENNDATSFNPYNDEQVIINISVWQSIASLETFVYKTVHTDFLKRRKEWFQKFGKVTTAMWWISEGDFPSVENAVEQLDYLQKNGPSQKIFDFRNKYAPPIL